MKSNRKIIVFIATSADGDVGWLNRPRPKGNYGYSAFFKTVDTIVWGRKTYSKGIEMGMKASGYARGFRNYVFSRTPQQSAEPEFTFVNGPIKRFVQELRAQPGKNIWMMGGGGIIASFLDEGEIDEFIIHVIPILIGEGIPLLEPRHRSIPLKLLSAKAFPDGVLRLNYRATRRT